MSLPNASPVFSANGPANKTYTNNSFSVTDAGQEINIATLNTQSKTKASRILIINLGANPVRIGFDIDASSLNYADSPGNSWNLHLNANGNDGDRYGNDKSFTSIAFKTDTALPTNLYIIIE